MNAFERRLFCNRTLNFRSIRAIGYDMDYTLIHYNVKEWEAQAYRHTQRSLVEDGFPFESLEFQPSLAIRGLIIDLAEGNVVKANRFGFVKRAYHGTQPVSYDRLRETYSRVVVDLSEPRWQFMNTLFSISEACLYMQAVDLFDRGLLPEDVNTYEDVYYRVRANLDMAHLEGQLKGEIVKEPDRFVELDEQIPLALLDQYHADRKLLLITNSDWRYTRAMMSYAFDRFLPGDMTWKDLFEVTIVEARKPDFFTSRNPVFKVVDEAQGFLEPSYRGIPSRGVYLGGHAAMVESCLGLSGDQILYVGDHIFSDVNVSKSLLRWRTALVLREIEDERVAIHGFQNEQRQLQTLMVDKEQLETEWRTLRLQQQRIEKGYGPTTQPLNEVRGQVEALRERIRALDEEIAPLARRSSELGSEAWGLLMRTGNDKSHLARQVERYADIYMARVSDLAISTPFAYVRSARGSLPHDPSS